MKHRARIILEYLAASILITLLLLAIAGVVAVKFYGEDLQSYVMEQVNQRIDSKIDVEQVKVGVLRKFPNVSLLLSDLIIWSSINFDRGDFGEEGADTLLTAETVSISFNILSLLRGRYNIRQLEVKNGELHLFTDLQGEPNFLVTGHRAETEKPGQQLNISSLKAHDIGILLNNRSKQLKSSGFVERFELNGRFSKRNTQIKSSLEGYLFEVSNKNILYASNREIRGKLNLEVNDSIYTIQSGQLQVDRILADVDGRFLKGARSGIELDLFTTARNLEIHEVLDLLPSEMSSPLAGIRGDGGLQLDARITGMANSTLTPGIVADFQTSRANLSWDRFPFTVRNLNLSGTYSNGGEFNPVTTSLEIDSISVVIGEDHLSGRGSIHNFYDPDFSFELKGDLHPGQWLDWYGSIPLHEASGTVISDLKVSGTYDRLKQRGSKFLAFDISGGISLEDVMFRIRQEQPAFAALNGTLFIDNDFWEPSLSGTFGSSDFSIDGSGLNLISFLINRDEQLVASARFRSNHLDLQEILDHISGKGDKEHAAMHFPENLNLKLDFTIQEFQKERLSARNVRGTAHYESPSFFIESLTMQTMEGTLTGEFGLIQEPDGSIFTNVNSTLHSIDIQQLFYTFNNFGQNQLTHEHLKGTISGTAVFSSEFDSTFSIQPGTILSESDVTIHDGELNGFSPILALSRFIEVDELQNIQFETLKNTILIRDRSVIIPAMDIQSNALDLSASGIHGFNNHYDYRLMLKLSDLLYNKARGSRNAEFVEAEDASDTRILFLKIINTGSGALVELDRERTARKIRDDMKEERNELKKVLNQELGLFKRDTTITREDPENAKETNPFRFEFSDEPETDTTVAVSGTRRRGLRDLFRKDTVQNKPASKFVIDEEPG